MSKTNLQDIVASFPDGRARALYQLGLDQQWFIDHVLDWRTFNFDRLPPAIRLAMATIYSDILQAEEFGLELGARIVELAPEGWSRELTVLQMRDEVRHVDFFARVVGGLGGDAQRSDEIQHLRDEVLAVRTHEELMLHALILECGARAAFVGNALSSLDVIGKGVRLPGTESIPALMHALVDYVGRDEARHIATGVLCLRAGLSRLPAGEARAMMDRARTTAILFRRSLLARASTFARLGLSPEQIGDRVWKAIRSQLQRLDMDIGEPEPAPPTILEPVA